MKKEDKYQPITEADYDKLFGVNNPEICELHKEALKKAWEIRNFEINKFWQRSAFFWGFIVLIFGGYITVVTGEFSKTENGKFLYFYLILLGIIFSVAWLLVICGSKRWQDNWEKHIDCLEDRITGPLYKTIFYTGKRFYSVSGINQILAWVVIATWFFLLIQYFYINCYIFKNIFEIISNNFQFIFFIILPFVGTVICIILLVKKETSGGEINVDLKKGEQGAFFVRER